MANASPSGIKIFFRKLRYLNYRGTLFHKTPLTVRKIRRRKRMRIIRRWFLCVRFTLLYRYRRFYNFQIRTSLEKSKFIPSAIPAPSKKSPEKKLSFSQKIKRLRRLLKVISARRKLLKQQKKLLRKAKISRWKIRYRKLRYLSYTGALYKVDPAKSKKYIEKKIGFITKREHLIITINSTAVFLLAAVIVYVLKETAVFFAAKSFQIPAKIYYDDIDFLIRGNEWKPDAVKVIFSAGPLATLMMAITTLIAYTRSIDKTWFSRTLLLWIFCHAIINFLGEVLAGTLMSEGFGWVLMYLFMTDTGKLFVSFISIILLITAGLFLSRTFLFTANTYYNYISGSTKNKFLFSQITLPYVFGNILLWLIKMPGMTQMEITINLSMILLLLPVIIRNRFSQELYFEEEPKKIHLFFRWILISLLIVVLFRIIFGIGVRYGF